LCFGNDESGIWPAQTWLHNELDFPQSSQK